MGFNGLTASSFNSWLTTGFLFASVNPRSSDPTKCWNGQNYSNGCFDNYSENRQVFWWTSTSATCPTCYNTGGPLKYGYTQSGYAKYKSIFGSQLPYEATNYSAQFLNYPTPWARRDFAFPVRCVKD